MEKEVIAHNINGRDLKISIVGEFKIDDLNKEYIIYSLVDDDNMNKDGHLIIGEVIREGDTIKVDGIKKEEEQLVLAYYSEISKKLGES